MSTFKRKSSSQIMKDKELTIKDFNVRESLDKITGEFDPKEIAMAIFEWEKSKILCENSKSKQFSLEHARYSLESGIFGLEFSLRSMKRSLQQNLYQYQFFCTPTPDIGHLIKELEFHLKLHMATLNYVKWAKRFLFDENYIFLQAIIKVFTLGENLGLQPIRKSGVGRGNKSKMLSFVETITGISDRKKLRRYQALYEKFKIDFEFQSKVLSLPQLLSLKPLLTSSNR